MHPDITFRTKSNKKKISNEMNKVKMEVRKEIQEEGGEVGMLMSLISTKQFEEPGWVVQLDANANNHLSKVFG